ncbi:MAG: SDR family NAD(P)-dependent oxidoreductase [Planctomycetota bacterium]
MDGRVVFITGVSSGLGAGLALEHLDRGDRVFGTSRREPPCELLEHARFRDARGDLRDPEQAAEIVATLLGKEGRVDLAWLNAGVLGEIVDMQDATLDELRATMETNVWANKSVLDALFALEVPVHQILTISSGAAVNGNRGWGGYAISKAALNMLTQLYAAECEDTHFCALAPGLVDTAMQESIRLMPPDPRFPSLDKLRAAGGTDFMPGPREAARRLVDRVDFIRSRVPSGSFADIRLLA